MGTFSRDARTIMVGPPPRIAVETEGQGEALLFVHGISGNRTNWKPQLAHFAETHQVVALDLRGYGDSDDLQEDFTFSHFTQDVAKVVEALDLPCVHLVGLSMGGLIAQAYYSAYPSKVASMVLAACRPGSSPVFPEERKKAFIATRLNPLERGGTIAAIADSLAVSLVSAHASKELVAEVRDSILRLRLPNYVRILRARVAMVPFLDLSRIDIPVLVVAGSEDTIAPVPQMQDVAHAIRDSQLAVIEGAGHMINLERPAEFNRTLDEFLASQAQRSGAE